MMRFWEIIGILIMKIELQADIDAILKIEAIPS
jgi:hypothetical protein